MTAYELGRKAFDKGKPRDPMKDQRMLDHMQTNTSSEHHPSSPGATMTARQRRALEEKLNEWKRGWDDAHQGK